MALLELLQVVELLPSVSLLQVLLWLPLVQRQQRLQLVSLNT